MFNHNLFITFLLLFIIQPVTAQVYKCESPSGQINFSDESCSKGETGHRLNWLDGTTSTKKKKLKKINSQQIQAKKTAAKARKNNQAYTLLSLLTTTQLELETVSLYSSYQQEKTKLPELILPDGLIVDLLKVDKIIISSQYGKNAIKVHFIMANGYEQTVNLQKPYPVLHGAAKIGRFSKSLGDIRRIEFFNSKKLLKVRARQAQKKIQQVKKSSVTRKSQLQGEASSINEKQSLEKSKQKLSKEDVPVIELDLSQQVADEQKQDDASAKIKIVPLEHKTALQVGQLKHRTATKSGNETSVIQVLFVNDKKMQLHHNGLSTTKGHSKSQGAKLILNDNKQIAFAAIKRIKIRPTANNLSLLVAIELTTKEIKMEVMLPPFTRILGQSMTGKFNHSLLELKSISFHK